MLLHPKSFWRRGLRFACQGSEHGGCQGQCCTARIETGYVYILPGDLHGLAAFFAATTAEIWTAFCDETDGHLHLRHPERDCLFLAAGGCTVYEARPLQCRTWPFWPENLASPRAWQREVVSFCPGAGCGKLFTVDEIVAILSLQQEA